MSICSKPVFYFLLSLSALTCARASDLVTFKGLYGKNTDEIRTSYKTRFDGLQIMYVNALQSFQEQTQGKGDLKATKAAISEIERFKKARCLPAETADDEIPEIKALQEAYVGQYSKLESEMLARLCDLSAKYEQALERLQKDLTRALKLDEATAVMEERQKAKDAINDFNVRITSLKGGHWAGEAAPDAMPGNDAGEVQDTPPESVAEKIKASVSVATESVAEPAVKRITVYVDAKTVGRGGNTKSSRSKVRNMTCEVSARLTSFDVRHTPARVIVFFIGRDSDGSLLVAEKQEREVELDKAKGWVGSFTSKDIRENDPYHYFYYDNGDRRWFNGAKLQGWVVQVWACGQLAGKGASLNQLMKYADSKDLAKEIGLMLEGNE